MKKNTNLKKLVSFSLISLISSMSSGNLLASEKKAEKCSRSYVSSWSTLQKICVGGVVLSVPAAYAAVRYASKKTLEENPGQKVDNQTPIDPKQNVNPNQTPNENPTPDVTPQAKDDNINNLVPNIDITKETKTKIDDVYLLRGDITKLHVDAIVNAAKPSLLGGGGVDGAIHTAAGPELLAACEKLHGCETGEAKITRGYKLPCKHVIHTVGPCVSGNLTEEHCKLLASCYYSCLKLADENKLNSIAFCCISTYNYGFPNQKAAEIAIETVRKYKNETNSKIKAIFDVFTEVDENIYKKILL